MEYSSHLPSEVSHGKALPCPGYIGIPRVSLIVPTKNEARNLEVLLPSLPAWVYEVIIVDGLSTDDTIEVARKIRPDARILMQPVKGKGAAMRMGFAAATGDVIVSFDADGSAGHDELPQLIMPLVHGYDFAKGSRFVHSGRSDDITLIRWIGNWGLTRLVNILYRARFTDLCYGLFAFRRDKLGHFDLTGVDGFEIETALQIQALKTGLKIVEIPSIERARIHGDSHLHALKDGWRILKVILGNLLPSRPTAAIKEPLKSPTSR